MPRYKIIVEYLGTNLAGFQRQKDVLSVQELIEVAIAKFSNESPVIFASGRTDAGVHALGQVVHFDLIKEHQPYTVMRAINHFLKPYQISVLHSEVVDTEFHARFSAKARHYLYRISNRAGEVAIDRDRVWWVKHELDLEAMRQASKYLIGQCDFTSFRAVACQAKSPIKTLNEIKISRSGEEVHFTLSAPSFLHHMVRNIVGSLVLVGTGAWKPEGVKQALDAKDRKCAGPTAPAHGLYFVKVDY